MYNPGDEVFTTPLIVGAIAAASDVRTRQSLLATNRMFRAEAARTMPMRQATWHYVASTLMQARWTAASGPAPAAGPLRGAFL